MGALRTIVGAISDDVVAALAAGGYPPLTPDASGNPGKIWVGTAALFEQTHAPRIIFEPIGSKFSTPDYASASTTLDTVERRRENAFRTIAAEDMTFTVRCWGAARTGEPVDDYDVTRALYHQVRASLHKLYPGCYQIESSGKYTVGTNVDMSGREFVFDLTIFAPVLSDLEPFNMMNLGDSSIANVLDGRYAPAGVSFEGSDYLVIPTGQGSTEPGCS